MSKYTDKQLTDLVQEDCVHRSLYTDPEIFELEMKRIWGRAWIYVGHESQIPSPGDYFTAVVARQPVIMIRHTDNSVKVMFNRCAHKGSKVLEHGSGNAKIIRCGYHGWTYKTDGTCGKVTGGEEAYEGTNFGRQNPYMNLQHLPRSASYRGFVFASLSPEGAGLETWLGPTKTSFDNMVDRSPDGALEVTGGVLRYRHDSNWKFFVENLNDMMHAMIAHQSSAQTARLMGEKLFKDGEVPPVIQILSPFSEKTDFFEKMGIHAFNDGHSYSGGKISIHSAYSDIPEYTAAMETAYGKERTREIFSMNRHNTVVYPGFTLKGAIQTIRVVKPIAVNETIIESWTFRLVGAPDELLRRSILYCNLINSSANLVGPDDYEAYHRLQHGLTTQGTDWISMHRYLDHDEENDEGGRSATGSSDMVFRNQFKAWKNYMTQNSEQ